MNSVRLRSALSVLAVVSVFGVACSPPVMPGTDAGADAHDVTADVAIDMPLSDHAADGNTMCASDNDCGDGVFCNGVERCMPGGTGADARGCAPASPASPCSATETCDETSRRCQTTCDTAADADGDGHRSTACGGDDCDDSDRNRFPGNTEVCDTSGHDEDCDPSTFGFRDQDMDGVADAHCCNTGTGGSCGTDCNDSAPGVHPAATETCNMIDDDCDTMVDEGVEITFYRDADNDGYGDMAGATMMGCSAPTGFVMSATDCDDTRASVHPGAVEVCDSPDGGMPLDENCDGDANPTTLCMCTVGMSRSCPGLGRCATGTQACISGSWGPCSIMASTEVCNSEDDDCDGMVDEGVSMLCYPDADGDGHAVMGATPAMSCGGCGMGTTAIAPTATNADCDDTRATVFTGAPEICDGRDSDCSSGGGAAVAEDFDGDGHTAVGFTGCGGATGFPRDDCRDDVANAFPGQTQYFETPFCPMGYFFCSPCGRCVPPSGICDTMCMLDVAANQWDYNCDGADTRSPATAACSMGRACDALGGCGTSGYQYSGTPACGTLTTYSTCGCGGLICSPSSSTRPLACH